MSDSFDDYFRNLGDVQTNNDYPILKKEEAALECESLASAGLSD